MYERQSVWHRLLVLWHYPYALVEQNETRFIQCFWQVHIGYLLCSVSCHFGYVKIFLRRWWCRALLLLFFLMIIIFCFSALSFFFNPASLKNEGWDFISKLFVNLGGFDMLFCHWLHSWWANVAAKGGGSDFPPFPLLVALCASSCSCCLLDTSVSGFTALP